MGAFWGESAYLHPPTLRCRFVCPIRVPVLLVTPGSSGAGSVVVRAPILLITLGSSGANSVFVRAPVLVVTHDSYGAVSIVRSLVLNRNLTCLFGGLFECCLGFLVGRDDIAVPVWLCFVGRGRRTIARHRQERPPGLSGFVKPKWLWVMGRGKYRRPFAEGIHAPQAGGGDDRSGGPYRWFAL